MKKLGVVLPWDSPFCWRHCMENMLNWRRPPEVEIEFFFGRGFCPANRHNVAIDNALQWGADAVIHAGSDHIAEREYLIKLWDNLFVDGWDMATGIVPIRGVAGPSGVPFQPFALRAPDISAVPNFLPAQLVFSETFYEVVDGSSQSQEVHLIGSGAIAIKREVLEAMERPWFRENIPSDDLNFERIPTNDVEFVARAVFGCGFRLWLNTDIDIRHLEIFPIDHTYQERFKDKTNVRGWSPIRSAMDLPQF